MFTTKKCEEDFKQLIAENPDLPIVPMVAEEFTDDTAFCRLAGSIGNSRLSKVAFANIWGEPQYYEYDGWEITELVEFYVDRYCAQHECMPDKKAFQYADDQIAGLEWKDVIIVNIDPLDPEVAE